MSLRRFLGATKHIIATSDFGAVALICAFVPLHFPKLTDHYVCSQPDVSNLPQTLQFRTSYPCHGNTISKLNFIVRNLSAWVGVLPGQEYGGLLLAVIAFIWLGLLLLPQTSGKARSFRMFFITCFYMRCWLECTSMLLSPKKLFPYGTSTYMRAAPYVGPFRTLLFQAPWKAQALLSPLILCGYAAQIFMLYQRDHWAFKDISGPVLLSQIAAVEVCCFLLAWFMQRQPYAVPKPKQTTGKGLSNTKSVELTDSSPSNQQALGEPSRALTFVAADQAGEHPAASHYLHNAPPATSKHTAQLPTSTPTAPDVLAPNTAPRSNSATAAQVSGKSHHAAAAETMGTDAMPVPSHTGRRPFAKYKSPATHNSMVLKLQWAHVADLPEDWMERLQVAAAASGYHITGAVVREGCIELVFDVATFPSETNSCGQLKSTANLSPLGVLFNSLLFDTCETPPAASHAMTDGNIAPGLKHVAEPAGHTQPDTCSQPATAKSTSQQSQDSLPGWNDKKDQKLSPTYADNNDSCLLSASSSCNCSQPLRALLQDLGLQVPEGASATVWVPGRMVAELTLNGTAAARQTSSTVMPTTAAALVADSKVKSVASQAVIQHLANSMRSESPANIKSETAALASLEAGGAWQIWPPVTCTTAACLPPTSVNVQLDTDASMSARAVTVAPGTDAVTTVGFINQLLQRPAAPADSHASQQPLKDLPAMLPCGSADQPHHSGNCIQLPLAGPQQYDPKQLVVKARCGSRNLKCVLQPCTATTEAQQTNLSTKHPNADQGITITAADAQTGNSNLHHASSLCIKDVPASGLIMVELWVAGQPVSQLPVLALHDAAVAAELTELLEEWRQAAESGSSTCGGMSDMRDLVTDMGAWINHLNYHGHKAVGSTELSFSRFDAVAVHLLCRFLEWGCTATARFIVQGLLDQGYSFQAVAQAVAADSSHSMLQLAQHSGKTATMAAVLSWGKLFGMQRWPGGTPAAPPPQMLMKAEESQKFMKAQQAQEVAKEDGVQKSVKGATHQAPSSSQSGVAATIQSIQEPARVVEPKPKWTTMVRSCFQGFPDPHHEASYLSFVGLRCMRPALLPGAIACALTMSLTLPQYRWDTPLFCLLNSIIVILNFGTPLVAILFPHLLIRHWEPTSCVCHAVRAVWMAVASVMESCVLVAGGVVTSLCFSAAFWSIMLLWQQVRLRTSLWTFFPLKLLASVCTFSRPVWVGWQLSLPVVVLVEIVALLSVQFAQDYGNRLAFLHQLNRKNK